MMTSTLTSTEQQGVRRLMNTGLARAAQAFSQMVHRPATIEIVRIDTTQADTTHNLIGPVEAKTLLITEVVGVVGGRSYLTFSESESQALQAACLPTSLEGDQRTVMGEAVLKEIDNVISAAVITTLSEKLNLAIYGGVPQLSPPGGPAEERLTHDNTPSKGEPHLLVSARFFFEEEALGRPQFIWSFPPAWVALLKDYSNDTSLNASP